MKFMFYNLRGTGPQPKKQQSVHMNNRFFLFQLNAHNTLNTYIYIYTHTHTVRQLYNETEVIE